MASISQKFRQIISDISSADRRLMDIRTGFANTDATAPAAARPTGDNATTWSHTPRNS